MMRPLSPVWLALSLVANAALLVVCLTRGTGGRGEMAGTATPVSRADASRAKMVGEVDVSGLAPEVVAKIGAGDEATVRDLLLACGMEPGRVRWLVVAAVRSRFEAEKIAAVARQRGAGWWKEEPRWWNVAGHEEIDRREQAEVALLAGALPEAVYPWRAERMGFLPAEKLAVLRKLEKDYQALREKLPPQPWLPHESEAFRLLNEEEKRDREALLSREELAESVFRDQAESFARDLDKYAITDAELRVLWRADKERDAAMDELDRRHGTSGTRDPFAVMHASWPPEARAEEKRHNAIYEAKRLEVLGAERITRGNREADESFKGIVKVANKLDLRREQAEAVYAVLERVQTIVDEADVDADERRRLGRAAWVEMGEMVPPEAIALLRESLGWRHYWLKDEP